MEYKLSWQERFIVNPLKRLYKEATDHIFIVAAIVAAFMGEPAIFLAMLFMALYEKLHSIAKKRDSAEVKRPVVSTANSGSAFTDAIREYVERKDRKNEY